MAHSKVSVDLVPMDRNNVSSNRRGVSIVSELVKAYFEELAEGHVPNPESPERKAFEEWSRNR